MVLREGDHITGAPCTLPWGCLSILPTCLQMQQTPSISGDKAHPRPALRWRWDGGTTSPQHGAWGHLISLLSLRTSHRQGRQDVFYFQQYSWRTEHPWVPWLMLQGTKQAEDVLFCLVHLEAATQVLLATLSTQTSCLSFPSLLVVGRQVEHSAVLPPAARGAGSHYSTSHEIFFPILGASGFRYCNLTSPNPPLSPAKYADNYKASNPFW